MMTKRWINLLPTWLKQLGLGVLLLMGTSGWVVQSFAGDKENVASDNQAGGQKLNFERVPATDSTAGLRAFIDPATGRLVEPTGRQMSNMADSVIGLPRPHTGHEEAGLESGVMVDVRGRFDLAVHATITDDGAVEISHLPAPSKTTLERD